MSDTYLRSSSGLTIVNSAGKAFIATSYSSGIMSGDIKGAFLSDTSTASVTGTELVTNGTFDSNVTGWTAYTANGGSIAWQTGGYLRISNADTSDPPVHAYQAITTVVGQRYILTAQKVAGTHLTAYAASGLNSSPGFIDSQVTWTDVETGIKFLSFTATVTTTYVILRVNANLIATVDVDTVSVRLAEPDRSVNNKGLAVYGTITKTAVATGSNLVAYSGFNGSNYLLNTSSYNFGSPSLCIMGWFKFTDVSEYQYIGSVFDSTSVQVAGVSFYQSTGTMYLYDSNAAHQSTKTFNDGSWHFATAIFNGSQRLGYVDGELVINSSNTSSLTLTNVSRLSVGHYNYTNQVLYNFTGSLSLVRFSTSAPSPEQIKKIYNDEKALFQPNSQCTLYGSSDAVTALAYDDSNSTLLVGTSSGRSDFRGLERINNTTTAVTTAISASNGLIAEQ